MASKRLNSDTRLLAIAVEAELPATIRHEPGNLGAERYVQAFLASGDALAKHIRDNPAEADLLVLPMLFAYRHWLELRLKTVIIRTQRLQRELREPYWTHNLSALWDRARDGLLRVSDVDPAPELVLAAHAWTPRSTTARRHAKRCSRVATEGCASSAPPPPAAADPDHTGASAERRPVADSRPGSAAGKLEATMFSIDRGQLRGRRRYEAQQAAGLTARVVCDGCNRGWMADLEQQALRLLKPILLGAPTALDVKQQLLAAQWAVKTAMVGEVIQYGSNSFTQDDRDLVVGATGRPPIRARVCIAAYAMDEPVATRYMRGLGGVRRNGAALMDLYIHTIQVLHLVLSIRGTTTLPAGRNRSLEQLAEPLHMEIPIFPPVACCAWPPNHVMDDASLIEYSGGKNLDPGP
jgi:hypothetical protein